ncbi:MAG: elongation factor P [Alphaproteobacteria bacterium]
MKIGANSIRVGNVIEHNGKLWVVVKTQHVQPGKGGAFMQVEFKNLIDGTKLDERFRSTENIERVYLDEKKYQYLYESDGSYAFMDQETYEQILLDKNVVDKDIMLFLKEGMNVSISFYEEKPISIELPETVVLEVKEADPVVKGQTAASSYKPAVLENGLRISVPPHVESGMKVVVNTETKAYLERAKS